MASVSEERGLEQAPKQVDAVPDDDASLPAKGTPKNIKFFFDYGGRKQVLTTGKDHFWSMSKTTVDYGEAPFLVHVKNKC